METEVCLAALPDCEPLVLEHCLKTYSVDQDDTARVASTTGAAATEALDKVSGRGQTRGIHTSGAKFALMYECFCALLIIALPQAAHTIFFEA